MPIQPEHIPTVDRVNEHLRKRASGDLCQDVLSCNSWAAEAFLMEDLRQHLEGLTPTPHATRAETRLYLRAVSWFQYPPVQPQTLLSSIQQELALSPDDTRLFAQVFIEHLQDEAVEAAAQRIDELFFEAWNALNQARRAADLPWRGLAQEALPTDVITAKLRIEALRPLRDTIYYYRHLPHWLSWQGRK
jgi:hypothetical protein